LGFCEFTKICAEGHLSPQDLLLLKEGLVRRELLEKLQLPEIQKQELKQTNKPPKNKPAKTQTQLVAIKSILHADFTGKVNRCSLSTFSKVALKSQVTNCEDSDISVVSYSFS